MAVPPELREIVILSFMNPGTVLAGYLLGRKADEPQKIVVGAFASGFAGVVFTWLLAIFGLIELQPRSFAGVFVLSFLLGIVWTWVGFQARRPGND